MTTAVRRATVDDAQLISALNADVQAIHAVAVPWRFKSPGPETFPPSAAAELLGNPNNLIFFASLDGAAAGYAYAEVIRRPETPLQLAYEMIHLHHVVVRPQCRRRRVGTALLEAVRAAGKPLGIALLTLDVWTFNESARAFFRCHGFAPYNERLWNRRD
jgi:ribosomal protein S18 acetylase RimI-like enzyme